MSSENSSEITQKDISEVSVTEDLLARQLTERAELHKRHEQEIKERMEMLEPFVREANGLTEALAAIDRVTKTDQPTRSDVRVGRDNLPRVGGDGPIAVRRGRGAGAENDAAVTAYLDANGESSSSVIANALGRPTTSLNRTLRRLVASGEIRTRSSFNEKAGRNISVYYTIEKQ